MSANRLPVGGTRPIRLGVFDPVFGSLDLVATLDRVVALGLEAVELGSGGYPGDARCKPAELLSDRSARDRLRRAFTDHGLIVSALSCHDNPLHPDADRAEAADATYRDTVRLAAELEVGRVNLFSGCPGDRPGARGPSWVVAGWPPDFTAILAWQWDEVLLPYWQEAAGFARRHGVRLGFEMHPGFTVYNPRTLLRLRGAIGDTVGVNLDPSHLFWQGIDPLLAIAELGPAIVHVHAKDTALDEEAIARNGVLDLEVGPGGIERAYAFRTVGDAHGHEFWDAFLAALATAGYDHVVSIEHEDRARSVEDGLTRATRVLRGALAKLDGMNGLDGKGVPRRDSPSSRG